ncbi:hypothetical protein Tco_0445344, partial [Tanacetum coccineum]
ILIGTIPTIIPDTTLSVTPPTTHIDTTPILTISPTIPPSPDYTPTSSDYTPASLDYSPVSDMKFDLSEDPSSDHIPPLPATSLVLSSTNDSSAVASNSSEESVGTSGGYELSCLGISLPLFRH